MCFCGTVFVSEEIKQSSDVSQHFNQKSHARRHKEIMNSFERAKHNMQCLAKLSS